MRSRDEEVMKRFGPSVVKSSFHNSVRTGLVKGMADYLASNERTVSKFVAKKAIERAEWVNFSPTREFHLTSEGPTLTISLSTELDAELFIVVKEGSPKVVLKFVDGLEESWPLRAPCSSGVAPELLMMQMIFGTTTRKPKSLPDVKGTGEFSPNPIDGEAVLSMLSSYEGWVRRTNGVELDTMAFLRNLGYNDTEAQEVLDERRKADFALTAKDVKSWKTRSIPEVPLSSTVLENVVERRYPHIIQHERELTGAFPIGFVASTIAEVWLSILANECYVYLREYVTTSTRYGRGDELVQLLINNGGKVGELRRVALSL
jgi:hypothetical protein